MYCCQDCGVEFIYVEVVFEKHNLDSPPYERVKRCPRCHSTNYKEKEESFCGYCGRRIMNGKEFCGEFCRNSAVAEQKRAEERKIKYETSPVILALKEVEEYNHIHKTKYSYGEYFAKKKGSLL